MDANIDEHGNLTIKASCGIESYALKKWCEEKEIFDIGLVIDPRLPEPQEFIGAGVAALKGRI